MTAFLKDVRKSENLRTNWIRWPEWQMRWNDANDLATCVSLLHYGMQTEIASPQEDAERLRCYLLLAEGHLNSKGRVHGAITRKAFKTVVDRSYYRPLFGSYLVTLPPSGVAALLRFFRPKGTDEGSGIENIWVPDAEAKTKNHMMTQVNEELLNWLFAIWYGDFTYESEFGSRGLWPRNEKTVKLVNGLRPRVLEILHAYGHGKLESLLDKSGVVTESKNLVYQVRWELFTPDCLTMLENLALRRGKTVREALVNSSTAAKVLLNVTAAQQLLSEKQK